MCLKELCIFVFQHSCLYVCVCCLLFRGYACVWISSLTLLWGIGPSSSASSCCFTSWRKTFLLWAGSSLSIVLKHYLWRLSYTWTATRSSLSLLVRCSCAPIQSFTPAPPARHVSGGNLLKKKHLKHVSSLAARLNKALANGLKHYMQKARVRMSEYRIHYIQWAEKRALVSCIGYLPSVSVPTDRDWKEVGREGRTGSEQMYHKVLNLVTEELPHFKLNSASD